ncbi:MAG: 50S ribosomal protein L4 [Patescibacteria group bacterium]
MLEIEIKDHAGKNVGQTKLDPKIFDVPANPEVIYQVTVAYQANSRHPIAHTKDRSEVRGGGRKPWKQKGTGRARQGSIRSPQWRGGGVVFGPRNTRNFSKLVNRKVKRLALFMSLSERLRHKKMTVLQTIEMAKPKTKTIATILKNLKITGALLVIPKKDDAIQRSVRNLPKCSVLPANSLNAYEVLKYRQLIILEPALPEISKHFLHAN